MISSHTKDLSGLTKLFWSCRFTSSCSNLIFRCSSWIYSRDGDKKKHVNPAAILLGGSLYIYQNVISKHLSADCLFSPSCSEFSKQSIREFGVVKGILSSIDRVNRCNRIAEHDLKNFSRNPLTNRYNDPVSRYRKGKGDDSD